MHPGIRAGEGRQGRGGAGKTSRESLQQLLLGDGDKQRHNRITFQDRRLEHTQVFPWGTGGGAPRMQLDPDLCVPGRNGLKHHSKPG